MDFDIGNILYIVVTLVAVMIGLLGKKKKPPVAPSDSTEQGEAEVPGFMENLERVLNMSQENPETVGMQYAEPVQAEEEPVQATVQATETPGILEEYERMLEQRTDPELDIILTESDSTSEPLEVIHLDEEEGTDYFEIIRDFDAGTAVVYSAIINRVDY